MTHARPAQGVGAFNARREVVLFTDPLPREADGYRTVGDRIDVLRGDDVVHAATYGDLVAQGAADREAVVLLEVDGDGEPTRALTLARRA